MKAMKNFVEWKGGHGYGAKHPVAPDIKIEVAYEDLSRKQGFCADFCWQSFGKEKTIIAYRIVKDPKEKQAIR